LVDQLAATAGVDDASQLSIDALLAMDSAVQSGEPKKPYVTCDDEEVCVFNSYDVKEQLRGLSFRWDASRAAWARPTPEVLTLLAVDDKADITVEKLLACAPPEPGATDENGNALGAAGASLEMLHDEVLIYNSYAIRDKLRALEFRFDSERRAWVRSVFEVKRLLELEDHADITLDKILALSESMQPAEGEAGRQEGDDDNKESYEPPQAAGHQAPAPCRSPSPAMLDQTPGEHLLSSMGQSLQGWSKSGQGAGM